MIFKSRQHAGVLLVAALEKYRGEEAVVFALPRGGVVLGVEVAKALGLPMSLIIARKIGHPQNPEYAIGAITEFGDLVGSFELYLQDPDWLAEEVEKQRSEARRRRELYLSGASFANPAGKICIIVDDGLATGFTMRAALQELHRLGAKKLVVAVPVGPREVVDEIKKLVDELVCLFVPEPFVGGVGSYYQEFPQVHDEVVVTLLNSFL